MCTFHLVFTICWPYMWARATNMPKMPCNGGAGPNFLWANAQKLQDWIGSLETILSKGSFARTTRHKLNRQDNIFLHGPEHKTTFFFLWIASQETCHFLAWGCRDAGGGQVGIRGKRHMQLQLLPATQADRRDNIAGSRACDIVALL
jgi:hypothetical protein